MTNSLPINNKKNPVLLWGVFFLLLGFMSYGFYSSHLAQSRIWSPLGAQRLLVFSLIFFAVATLSFFLKPQYFWRLLVIVLLSVSVGSVGLQGLISVTYFLSSCFLLGDLIMRVGTKKAETDSGPLDLLLSVFLGSAIYIFLVGILVHFRVNFPVVYFVLLLIPFLLNGPAAMKYGSLVSNNFHSTGPQGWKSYFSMALMVFILILHLVNVIKPEVGFDALAMHLAIPSYVANFHQWSFDFKNIVWAVMPMGGDWIYSLVYMLGGEFAARWANFSFLLLTALLLFHLIRPKVSAEVSFLMVAIFLSNPLVQLVTGSIFVENIWAAIIFSSIAALYRYRETGENKFLYLIGSLLGTAMSIKTTSLFAVVLICVFVFFEIFLKAKRSIKKVLLPMSLFMGLLLLFGLPHYLYAFYKTGNPVFPFMNGFFKSPFYPLVSFKNPIWSQTLSWSTLYDITIHSHKYLEGQDGSFGFSYFVLIPLSLIVIRRGYPYIGWISLILATFFFSAVFKSEPYLRYIYPCLPLFLVPIAIMIEEIRKNDHRLFYFLSGFCLISILANSYFMPTSGWLHRDFYIDGLFGKTEVENYVKSLAPEKKIIAYLNLKKPGSGVCFLHRERPFIAELNGRAFSDSWHNNDFCLKLRKSPSAPDLYQLFRSLGITYFIFHYPLDENAFMKPPIKSFLKEYSTTEFNYGWLSLASLKSELMYTKELLENNDFAQGLEKWTINGNVMVSSKTRLVSVNVNNTLSQAILVNPNTTYSNSITARSRPAGHVVRIQVNWLNEKGKFIGTSIFPKRCTGEFQTFSEKFNPPNGAEKALIFVTGHTDDFVEVQQISFAI